MSLRIERDENPSRLLLRLVGDLDVYTTPLLKDAAIDWFDAPGPAVLVVDLSEVAYLDSSGLGVLIGTHQGSKQVDRALRIVASTPRVARTFEITRMGKLLPLYPSCDAALEGL